MSGEELVRLFKSVGGNVHGRVACALDFQCATDKQIFVIVEIQSCASFNSKRFSFVHNQRIVDHIRFSCRESCCVESLSFKIYHVLSPRAEYYAVADGVILNFQKIFVKQNSVNILGSQFSLYKHKHAVARINVDIFHKWSLKAIHIKIKLRGFLFCEINPVDFYDSLAVVYDFYALCDAAFLCKQGVEPHAVVGKRKPVSVRGRIKILLARCEHASKTENQRNGEEKMFHFLYNGKSTKLFRYKTNKSR